MAKAGFKPKRLLLVHAHPDDESIYTGHIIAKALKNGADVMVLTLTRGERGTTSQPAISDLNGDLLSMGAYRSGELANALKALGGPQHRFLGARAYRDSGLRRNSFGRIGRPRKIDELSLAGAATSVVAQELLQVIKEFRPDAVVTYNSSGGNGHPDHRAAYLATAMALRNYKSRGNPPKFWSIAAPSEKFDVEISGVETQDQKRAALESHGSQIAIDESGYSFGDGKTYGFAEPERLRLASPNPLIGLRPVLTYFWALPLGVLVAVAGTLMHQVRAADSQTTPIGVVIALIMVGSLAIALRLLRNSRGALYLMTAAFSATVFALSQRQAGGEVLIPANTLGNIWAYGAIALCFAVILFPSLSRKAWSTTAPSA